MLDLHNSSAVELLCVAILKTRVCKQGVEAIEKSYQVLLFDDLYRPAINTSIELHCCMMFYATTGSEG